MADFDPYHRWLGIPPEEQPPNWYRLLGLRPLESDPDVIATAADRQMAHVRTFQSGKQTALSQKLLNEISAARVGLLNAARKQAYDQQLIPLLDPERAQAETFAQIVGDQRPRLATSLSEKPRSFLPAILLGLSLGVVAVVGLFAMVFWNNLDSSAPLAASAKPETTPAVEKSLPIAPEKHPPADSPAEPAPTSTPTQAAEPLPAAKSPRDFSNQLVIIRRAIAERNPDRALQLVGEIPKEECSSAQFAVVLRLKQIAELVKRFWNGVEAAVQQLQPGAEIQVGDAVYHFNQVDSGGVNLTVGGDHWRYAPGSLPADLAFKLASQHLPGTAQSLAVLASFQTVDPHGKQDIARQLWRTAQQKGYSTEELALELEASWPHDVSIPTGQIIRIRPDIPEVTREFPASDARSPVPSASSLATATESLEKIIGGEQAKAKRPADKVKLVERLLKLLPDARDPAEQYAVLSQATTLAAEAGDINLLRSSLEKLHQLFRGELGVESVLDKFLEHDAPVASQRQDAAELICNELYFAIAEHDYTAAEKMTTTALLATKKGDLPARNKELTALKKDLAKALELERNARGARERLLANASDGEANLALGSYLSLYLDQWSAGLPLLTKSVGDLATLAQQETSYTAGGDNGLAIAAAWNDYANKQKGLASVGALRHAIDWQTRAISQLTGIEQSNARLQLTELIAKLPSDLRKLISEKGEAVAPSQAFLADLKLQNAGEVKGKFKKEAKTVGATEYPHAVELTLSPGESGKLVYDVDGRYDHCQVTFFRPDMLDTDPVAVCKFICDGRVTGDVAIAKSAIRADLRIPNVKRVEFQIELAAATAATEPGKQPIVLLDGVFAKGEVTEQPATAAKPAYSEAEDLHVLAEMDPRTKKVISEMALDLRASHAIFRDGKEIGSYKRTGDKLSLSFNKDDFPNLTLRASGKSKGVFLGVQEHPGKSTSWKLEPVTVIAVWRHFTGPTQGKDVPFYSNGRMGDPTGTMTYEINNNRMTLDWGKNQIEQVEVSGDEKSYRGRTAQGQVIAGVRVK